MLALYLFMSLFYLTEQYQALLTPELQQDSKTMIKCVTVILDKYFAEKKQFTFVNMHPDNEELLKVIHTTMHFSLISKGPTKQMFVPNQGYVVFSPDVKTFSDYFEVLKTEPYWNPYARFLIIIESLQSSELGQIFDILLWLHVNNVLVVNGTAESHLYTYNPFDKYACGRYYDDILDYGQCLHTTQDLYPNKLVTGLRNCTFRGSLAFRPPYTMDPSYNPHRNKLMGLEEAVLKMASKSDGFDIDFKFNYNGTSYTTITSNMTAVGAMDKLQKNETDVMFGAVMITNSYVSAFTFVSGHHDYVDEIRFAVKKASFVPNWKYFYIEFEASVWALLLICTVVYSVIMIVLLGARDKSEVVLRLVDNLLGHGRDITSPMTVKSVFLIWVWFAYLVNTFYQSSLVSLTTNPSKEYQISSEEDLVKYNIRPCLSYHLAKYLYTDPKDIQHFDRVKVTDPACFGSFDGIHYVGKHKETFTLLVTFTYLYHKEIFYDEYGDPLIHFFKDPYSKLLTVYYFYKGFPVSERFRLNIMRMRESGLAEKNMRDHYYMLGLKYHFASREFEYRFIFPWCIYVIGCLAAFLCFGIEFMRKCIKCHRFHNRV